MIKFGLKQYIPIASLSLLSFATASSAATAYINQVGYRTGDVKEFALLKVPAMWNLSMRMARAS